MRCICSNYSCTLKFFLRTESYLYYTRFITLAVAETESGQVVSARTLPEPDEVSPKPRLHKEARFGPTVVFPVH